MKFPLNVNLESIDGSVDRAQLKNAYAEVAGANEVKVYSRPALQLAQGSFAAFGQGVSQTPDGQLFVVSGGNIYLPVPQYSEGVSALGTFTAVGTSVAAAYNGSAYIFGGVTPFWVYRAVPPFSTFSTLGTNPFNGTRPLDVVVHNNAVTVLAADRNVYYTTNGTSWGTYGAGAHGTGAILYSHAGNLYVYGLDPAIGAPFTYSANRGTSWGTGSVSTISVYGTSTVTEFTSIAAGSHEGYMYALDSTSSGVFRTTDGAAWEFLYRPTPWDQSGLTPLNGNRFLSLGGNMLAFHANSATSRGVWSSPNGGVSWNLAGTSTSPSIGHTSVFPFAIGSTPYVSYSTPTATIIASLDASGALSAQAALGGVGVGDGEIASIIGTESGVTFIKSSTAAYTISSGTLTQVTDAQYPAITVRGAVYLNGRLYVMEPDGTIWNSAEDDFTSWAGTDFIVAEFEADAGICLAKQGEYVIAFGQFTTEAFYDAGNATGSPLDPVGSAVMLIGCAHANSVAQVETSLVWAAQQKGQGSTFHKGRFVAFMKGYGSYDRISTPDVERVLDADAFNEVYSDIVTHSGHVFYLLTLVDSDITLCYDFRSQLWGLWDFQTAGTAQAVTSITAASQVATAILASHGYSDGDHVVVTGGTGTFTSVNGTYNVTVPNSGTFSYPISGSFAGTCTTGTAQGYSGGQLDISASCYFDNRQIVQLRTSGDVYYLDGTAVTDNGAPIDFRIRTRNWDGGTNREKFQGALDVVGDKGTSTALIRYTDDDFQSYTPFKRVGLSLRRPRAKRGGTFSRRAVELRHTLSAKVGISALEAEIEPGEQ